MGKYDQGSFVALNTLNILDSLYPGSRRPSLRTVTPACTKRFGEGRHFGVQARPLAVDECPDNGRGMSLYWGGKKLGATGFPVGLHFKLCSENFTNSNPLFLNSGMASIRPSAVSPLG